jgi:hypothetical protein
MTEVATKKERKPRVKRPLIANGDYRMSVLSYERRDGHCPTCDAHGIIYVCHGFKLWPDKDIIRNRCKSCAIKDAGGEEFVWVKTTFQKLRQVWSSGQRPEKPPHLPAGRLSQKARKVLQNAYPGALDESDG